MKDNAVTRLPLVKKFAAPVLLALFGVGLALGMLGLARLVFPGWFVSNRYVFTDLDGDTFRYQPGQVRPPTVNRVLEQVNRESDAYGFRLPALRADFYPVIALGDSFTDGGQTPWVDVLARALSVPVQNLGWSGFGPLHYAQVMARFGVSDSPARRWVLVMWFEGNDLSDTHAAYTRAQDTGGVLQLDLSHTIVPFVPPDQRGADIVRAPDDNYLYPLHHQVAGGTLDLAYIGDYIWWLNGTPDLYAASRNLAVARGALASIRDAAGGACVALVYAPDKSHIYLPYADPQGNLIYVLQNGRVPSLDADGWITFGGLEAVDRDALLGNLDNQRDALAGMAAELGIHFIDLLPTLQAAALTPGDALYYPYDSHWSTRGHQVAGETVAAYLQAVDGCGGG